jgi:hypothetical protein
MEAGGGAFVDEFEGVDGGVVFGWGEEDADVALGVWQQVAERFVGRFDGAAGDVG